jgi:hypothetical protein
MHLVLGLNFSSFVNTYCYVLVLGICDMDSIFGNLRMVEVRAGVGVAGRLKGSQSGIRN